MFVPEPSFLSKFISIRIILQHTISMKSKFKSISLLWIFLLSISPFQAEAAKSKTSRHPASHNESSYKHDLGLGVIFGEPTGFNAKVWTASDRALDFGLAFSLNSYVLLYGDYLFHFPGAFKTRSTFVNDLNPYVGIGLVSLFRSSAALGIRVPVGIEWIIPRSPFSIFAEIVPGMQVIPSTSGLVQGGFGGRVYF
jgi:hypothetical protein